MEGQEFLTEYRNISNKLKKRFLRRPNVSEASDQFKSLAKRLEDSEESQYAAFCHLAAGRCEQTVGNTPAEVEAITYAARAFLRAEMEVQRLGNPSFEEHLIASMAQFNTAARLEEEAGQEQLAANLHLELAETLFELQRPSEALPVFEKAARLLEPHIQDYIRARLRVADCYIASTDHHNAILVLSEVFNFAKEQDPGNLYSEVLERVEILRIILLLIISLSPHNTSPQLLDVLERFRGEGDEDALPSPHLDRDIGILLQSVVLAVEDVDTDALLYLEDQLAPRVTDQQRQLLRLLVKDTLKKV